MDSQTKVIGPFCTSKKKPKISGPTCAMKRAAEISASEKKVLFLHDDMSNATLLRFQMEKLAAELDKHQIVSYFGNSPTRLKAGNDGDDEDNNNDFKCLWYAGDEKLLSKISLPHIEKLSGRKGPFYATIAIGSACKLAESIAQRHNCSVEHDVVPIQPERYNGKTIDIMVLSCTECFKFLAPAQDSPMEAIDLPVRELVEFILAVTNPLLPSMFEYTKATMDELRARKLLAKQAAKDLLVVRTAENRERALLKKRKEAGEDVIVPPNTTRLAKDERRRQRKEAAMGCHIDFTSVSKTIDIIPYQQGSGIFKDAHSTSDVKARDTRLCNYVSAPMAEPVTPCSVADLEEMMDYLRLNEKIKDGEIRIDFTKGSILNHGGMAVDLCKQVVGPEGIEPILQAVGENKHVVRFLLGNNISGDRGARAIGAFIADEARSRNVYNFYIAGNEIGPAGMKIIAKALENDKKVLALWLKRNPIGIPGALDLAHTLRMNDTLQTLDLVNTAIFDEGAVAIFDALSGNINNNALLHLYIGSNALTSKTAEAASRYLCTGKSKLKTLYFAAGRFGNEGASMLAKGLKADSSIQRLGLSSERIGPEGARVLADALHTHPQILSLDLGLRRGTYVLGEQPNRIGDESAIYLVEKLLSQSNVDRTARSGVRSIDLTFNNISMQGIQSIVGLVEAQKEGSLLQLKVKQYGSTLDTQRLKQCMQRNIQQYGVLKKQAKEGNMEAKAIVAETEEVLYPRHVFDIYSVYRNNM